MAAETHQRLADSSPMLKVRISDMRAALADARQRGRISVGFVPTMGALHEGHLSLLRAARAHSDLVVLSLFVNPAQFGPQEDLDSYPAQLQRDSELAAAEGADMVFAPTSAEMYPEGHATQVDVGEMGKVLCGQSRPGHFEGVATVVAKLFNIVQPDRAWFGQKDAQQVAVIRRMVADLNYPVEIRVCPTVREADGLAMSSRNAYLSGEEREHASSIYRALSAARDKAAAGEASASKLIRLMKKSIASNYRVELEYARVVNAETMENIAEIEGVGLAVVAATIGRARLIDNMLIGPEAEAREPGC